MHSDKKFYGNIWKKFFDYCMQDTDYVDVLGYKLGEDSSNELNDDIHRYARDNNLYETDDHSYNTNGVDFDIDDYDDYDEEYDDSDEDEESLNLPYIDDEDFHKADLIIENDTVKFTFILDIDEKKCSVLMDFYENRDLMEELMDRLDEINSKGVFEIESIFDEENDIHLFNIDVDIEHLSEFNDEELQEIYDLFIQIGVYLKEDVLSLLFFD